MQVSAEIKRRVVAKVAECIKKAEKHYNRSFTMPAVHFTVRGTTAGYAYGSRKVDFNAVLLMENTEDFIARTVPHECAHIIDYVVNPENHERRFLGYTRTGRARYSKRDVHGADFRFIMERVLGADDSTRCHSYDVTRAQVKRKARHVWVSTTDSSVTMTLGPKRHQKMMSGIKYWPRGYANHTFKYSHQESQHPVAEAARASASHNRPKRVTTPPKGQWTSKKAHCAVLFDPKANRADNIKKFVSEAGCTAAGAATYYATIKKERGL